jgi:hypothetical protein
MIEAGQCSYETKARNVEKMGAQVAIIVEPEAQDDER